MKVYTIQVSEDIRPSSLFALIRRMLPELPEYVVREAFEKRDVKMNGIRAGKKEPVIAGSCVQLYTRYEPQEKQLEIIYDDANVLVIRKPAGISCDKDEKGGKTAAEWAQAFLAKENQARAAALFPCHRLDNQTEGLLLLAKGPWVQEALMDAFRERKIHKAYTCLTRGTPKKQHEYLRAYLLKNAEQGRVRIVNEPEYGSREILTEYEVLQSGEAAKLRVILHTGRTHQIRAQMAAIGHPLLGDDVYGDRAFNKQHKAKRLMLCATELSFDLEGELAYLNKKHFTVTPFFEE